MRAAIVALALILSSPAIADDRQAIIDCAADATRYCKAVVLTRDRASIVACMTKHQAKLQQRCRRHIQ